MSVRAGLLAILSLGPAYGLQLRDEFLDRAPHRQSINVGQVYGTLDRLMTAGLVRNAGATPDGLPLYGLTDAGRAAVLTWIAEPEDAAAGSIDDLLDHVLIVSSLPGADARALAEAYRRDIRNAPATASGSPEPASLAPAAAWPEPPTGRDDNSAGESVQSRAAREAKAAIDAAVAGWLDEFARVAAQNPRVSRGLRDDRPVRGRRPGSSGVPRS